MNKSKYLIKFLLHFVVMLFLMSTGCQNINGISNTVISDTHAEEETNELKSDPIDYEDDYLDNQIGINVPQNIVKPKVISIENAGEIKIIKKLYPYLPEMMQLSQDGKVGAIGGLSGIKIVNQNSGEMLMHIDVELPSCRFGMRKYFQLNHDGSFIAIATRTGIQVFQIGGGIIYESPYQSSKILDDLTCGMDVPQFSLSSDGRYLAESGIREIDIGIEKYFQITDILSNSLVYEWNGESDLLHGYFYANSNPGFSADGSVLQTFDPTRYWANGKSKHTAFRFWSTITFQELASDLDEIKKIFPPGERLFAFSNKNSISIIEKISGKEIRSIPMKGCVLENPCRVIFSPDGSKAAVLGNNDTLNYKRIPLAKLLTVYDVKTGDLLDEIAVSLSDLDGIIIDDSGKLTLLKVPKTESESTWWTHSNYFGGFRRINNSISFIPQVTDYQKPDLYYTGTCLLYVNELTLECMNAIIPEENVFISIEYKGQGFSFNIAREEEEQFVDILFPETPIENLWQVRFIDFVDETNIGCFCFDRNYREETCVLMDFSENTILHEQIDLFGFQYSREIKTGIFIDREKKALFLFNDETKSLKQMKSYQAVAYPIHPEFIGRGSDLLYVVRGLDKPNQLFIEKIDARNGKVIKRYDIDGLENVEITSIAANNNTNLWAIGDDSGYLYLINSLNEEIIQKLDITEEAIIDIIFSQDGKHLFTMARSGIITAWITEGK